MSGKMVSADALKFLRDEQAKSFADSAAQSEWTAQRWIWIIDEKEGFVAANIVKDSSESYEVRLPSGLSKDVNKNDTFKMNPPKFDKVEDMADLAYLNEPAVLDNLRKRYQSNLIYTYSGLFCVVVNPYKRLPIYTNDVVELYHGKRRTEMPPHVYAIADGSYRDMLQDRENQSILITGESGAGKTENTKKVIQYLAHIATGHEKGQGQLEEQLLQCNPVLEAFGNAKTIKNDNSSRFGKFIRIEFDRTGHISGGNIETYLLEKSRAIRQQIGERNFHIYYQLLKSATPDMRAELLLDSIDDVAFLSDKASSRVDGMDDVAEFANTVKAMATVGISEADRTSVWRTLSAIMKMSQMHFTQDRSEQAQLADDSKAAMVCKLLGMPLGDFIKAMLKPRIKVGRDYVTKAQRADQVSASVEAIAKAMHERLFLWIVRKINMALDTRRAAATFIGILDIAGFEIFQTNSFEQLCINFTNEKLQQFFNNHMFVVEQDEYKKEGIEWQFINFGLDLQPCIDLIEKPMGVLALLDEECLLLPRSSDKTLVEKLDTTHTSKSVKYSKLGGKIKRDDVGFRIEHYAGTVDYTCDGWLIKNTDPLNDNITALLAASADEFTRNLWDDMASFEGGRGRRAGSMRTVGQNYRDQLGNLMTTLNNTSPHFVRCIIPNHEKKPGKLDVHIVLDQLRCNGVLEGIRICRKGFPNRVPFQDFKQRYEILTPGVVPKGFMDGRKACERMLAALELDPNNYRVGSSKVFFRTGVLGTLEEMRDDKLSKLVRNLQAHCRAHLARKSFHRMTNHEVAVKIIQRNARKYLMLRTWPWWKLFVRVQPLLKVTQEDNLRRELDEYRRRADEVQAKSDALVRDFDAVNAEKASLKSELDRVALELQATVSNMERYQARIGQLVKEMEALEERCEEEAGKAEAHLAERKKLMQEKQAVDTEVVELRERATKLAFDKSTCETKLRAVEADLLTEKDANQKLAKEKTSLEAQLVSKDEQLVGAEERLKTLQKAKSKGEGALVELEERLAATEKERVSLVERQRSTDLELANLRDKLRALEKQCDDLRADLQRRADELAQVHVQLEDEQSKCLAVEKEKRDLAGQLDLLRDEFEAEQSAVAKLKKDKAALDAFIKELEDRVEDKDSASAAQAELRAKREAELASLKVKHEQVTAAHELAMSDLRRKAQQQHEALEAEVAALAKYKGDLEKRSAGLQQELDVAADRLAAEAKDRADVDKKRRALEAQAAEAATRLKDLERQVSESAAVNERLSTELAALHVTVEAREAFASTMERDKNGLALKVDELQAMLDDETRQKISWQARTKAAETDAGQAKELLAEKEEEMGATQRQMAQIKTMLDEAKAKAQREAAAQEEVEGARKKLAKENEVLLAQIDELNAAKSKLASTNGRLQSEADDLTAELETARNDAATAVKKAKKADSQVAEARAMAQEAEAGKRAAEAEASRVASDVLGLKAQLDALQVELARSRKENGALKAELNDVNNSTSKDAAYVAGLEKSKRTLEQLLEEQKTELEELEDELQQVEDVKVRLEVSMQALKQQMEREQSERAEAIEEARKGLLRAQKQLEEELEEERRGKVGLVQRTKKLEADLAEALRTGEEADKAKEEAVRTSKKAQVIARECQADADEARAMAADAESRLREAERKAQRYASENTAIATELERSEKSRKLAEAVRDEAQGEIDTLRRDLVAVADAKRRTDGELAAKQEEIEELQSEVDIALDKERKAVLECEKATLTVNSERDNSAKLAQRLQILEKANAELRDQVETAVRDSEKKMKARIAPLESKVAALQSELEQEARKAADAINKYKRNERKAKELARQCEEADKAAAEHKAQVERGTSKMRNQSNQIEELEMEVNSLRQKNRRLQTEINEATELSEQLRSQLASTQARNTRMAMRRRGSAFSIKDDQQDAAEPPLVIASEGRE